MDDDGISPDDRNRLLRALLIETVQRRDEDGQRTTLRDLHRLLDVPQPVALRLADRLRDEGVAMVEIDDVDAFASVIRITRSFANQIRAARQRQTGSPK